MSAELEGNFRFRWKSFRQFWHSMSRMDLNAAPPDVWQCSVMAGWGPQRGVSRGPGKVRKKKGWENRLLATLLTNNKQKTRTGCLCLFSRPVHLRLAL